MEARAPVPAVADVVEIWHRDPVMSGATATTPAGASRTRPLEHHIIFFDGVCAMCNRFVDLILRADGREVLRFAPLQGETARALLPPLGGDPREWSMVYLDERGIHDQADASLEVYRRLAGSPRPRGLTCLFPPISPHPAQRPA